MLGIVLPILPTTPLLLLAAICFARGSESFYIWLLTNRYIGGYLCDWRENRGLTNATKLRITFVLAAFMGLSVIFFVSWLPARIVLVAIGLGVSAYIWRLPTKSSSKKT